jgi:hypothetical protein
MVIVLPQAQPLPALAVVRMHLARSCSLGDSFFALLLGDAHEIGRQPPRRFGLSHGSHRSIPENIESARAVGVRASQTVP